MGHLSIYSHPIIFRSLKKNPLSSASARKEAWIEVVFVHGGSVVAVTTFFGWDIIFLKSCRYGFERGGYQKNTVNDFFQNPTVS